MGTGDRGQEHVDVIRGDDTYRFLRDGSVELIRKGVGSRVGERAIQDENIIQKDEIDRSSTDPTGAAIRLGRTDIATYGADGKLREFRTTAAPGAVFGPEGALVRGGPPEVKTSPKRWRQIAEELRHLEGYIAKDLRGDPAVIEFYQMCGRSG